LVVLRLVDEASSSSRAMQPTGQKIEDYLLFPMGCLGLPGETKRKRSGYVERSDDEPSPDRGDARRSAAVRATDLSTAESAARRGAA